LNSGLHKWDGAAESIRAEIPLKLTDDGKEWREAYYRDVILPDEKMFLVSAAAEHLKVVEGVMGEKAVVIKDGKGCMDVREEVMAVWREYEAKGKKQG